MGIKNELGFFKNENNLTNVQLAEMMGVTSRTIATMLTRNLKPMEALALKGLKAQQDRRSNHVSIEVKYGSSRISVSREGRDRKSYARDYQYDWAENAAVVAREYVNEMLPDIADKVALAGTAIDRGDHYVFTLDWKVAL